MERSVNNFIRKMPFFKWPRSAMRAPRNGEPEPSKPSTPSSHQAAADEMEKKKKKFPVCHVSGRLPADDKFAQSDALPTRHLKLSNLLNCQMT